MVFYSATFGNPLNWIREKLTPTVREKSSEEEIMASQQAAEAEGKRNLFESAAEEAAKARLDPDGNMKPTRIFTEVARFSALLFCFVTDDNYCSTNIRLQISRYLIASST